MGQNGRETLVDRFTWSKVAAQTLDVYRQLSPEAWHELTAGNRMAIHEAILQDSRITQEPSVTVEAKLMVPEFAENGAADALLESLKSTLAGRGFVSQRRDHTLKFRGDWENVTTALSECSKWITPADKGFRRSARSYEE